jgi:hypothetical protein
MTPHPDMLWADYEHLRREAGIDAWSNYRAKGRITDDLRCYYGWR